MPKEKYPRLTGCGLGKYPLVCEGTPVQTIEVSQLAVVDTVSIVLCHKQRVHEGRKHTGLYNPTYINIDHVRISLNCGWRS